VFCVIIARRLGGVLALMMLNSRIGDKVLAARPGWLQDTESAPGHPKASSFSDGRLIDAQDRVDIGF
jgi:hypothetical protein